MNIYSLMCNVYVCGFNRDVLKLKNIHSIHSGDSTKLKQIIFGEIDFLFPFFCNICTK